MKDKQITIAEVAKKAGVSTKTVSRVINNEKGVRENTAKKVKTGTMTIVGIARRSINSFVDGSMTWQL